MTLMDLTTILMSITQTQLVDNKVKLEGLGIFFI